MLALEPHLAELRAAARSYRLASRRHSAYFQTFVRLWRTLRHLNEASRRLAPPLNAKLDAPVFIFANARSGSTFLHNLLACDQERFAPLPLYASVFASRAVTQSIRHAGTSGLDLRPAEQWVNQRLFSRWSQIHPMGLSRLEEDEAIFTSLLASPSALLLTPNFEAMGSFTSLDAQPEAHRNAVMEAYDLALRHALPPLGGRQYLAKNVLLASRMRALMHQYPKAQFVYLVRDPRESLPSLISLFFALWRAHSPTIEERGPEVAALARLGAHYYRYALNVGAELPASRFHTLHFDTLTQAPLETLERLYEGFGWSLSPVTRRAAEALTRQTRHFRSSHSYSLARFGLDEAFIQREFGDIVERFGFYPLAKSA